MLFSIFPCCVYSCSSLVLGDCEMMGSEDSSEETYLVHGRDFLHKDQADECVLFVLLTVSFIHLFIYIRQPGPYQREQTTRRCVFLGDLTYFKRPCWLLLLVAMVV